MRVSQRSSWRYLLYFADAAPAAFALDRASSVPGGVESSWIADLYEIYLRWQAPATVSTRGHRTRTSRSWDARSCHRPGSGTRPARRGVSPPATREASARRKFVNLVDGFSW